MRAVCLPIRDMEPEWAWLTGIIEGEGCIDLKKRKGCKDALRVRVSITDEDIIARVCDLLGTSYHGRDPGDGYKCQYETAVTGKNALTLVEHIWPLLGERRRSTIIELCEQIGEPLSRSVALP